MSSAAYLVEQLQQMMIKMHESTGSGEKADVVEGINAMLAMLMGHHLLFDSKLTPKVLLSKSIYGEMPGPLGIMPLLGFSVENSDNSSSQQPKTRTMGAGRHKDVEVCLISAYALSLWYRFDFEDGSLFGDKRPNFLDRPSWNPYKLLFDDTPESAANQPIPTARAEELVQKCMDSIGFNPARNTQRLATDRVAEYQAERAGPMKQDVIERSSDSYLPVQFVLFSAGFPAHQPYYIARNVTPPPGLEKEIFPWAEELLPQLLKRESEDLETGIENDGMGISFVETLQRLRVFILQDLAVLVDKAPNSIFCQHPITKCPQFREFKKLVDRAVNMPCEFQRLSTSKILPNVFSSVVAPNYDMIKSELQRYKFIQASRLDPDENVNDDLLEQIEKWSRSLPATPASQELWSLAQSEILFASTR